MQNYLKRYEIFDTESFNAHRFSRTAGIFFTENLERQIVLRSVRRSKRFRKTDFVKIIKPVLCRLEGRPKKSR